MARIAKSWQLRKRDGVYYVRISLPNGSRAERSTGTGDAREAAARADAIRAALVAAGDAGPRRRVDPLRPLDELMAMWLVDLEKTHDPETAATYTNYARRYVGFFGNSFANITRARLGDYQRDRLTKVLRSSVRKERSSLNTFLEWCEEQGVISEEHRPSWPKMHDRADGVRAGKQRSAPVDVTVAQVRAFLEALPLWSGFRRGVRFPVRARFVFMYETSLRPATIDAIAIPRHWRPGSTRLFVTRDIDKARYERTLELSPLAAAVLEAVAATGVTEGPLFGVHDYRSHVERAREAAGLPEEFAPYDLRHGRIGHLLDSTGDMRAVAFIGGHRRLTTTDRYLRGQADRARDAVTSGGAGGILGEHGGVDMSAKEGNRTPTRVTPLEPEGSGAGPSARSYKHSSGQEDPESTTLGLHNGAPPVIGRAASFLAAIRAQEESFDAFVHSAEGGEGES